jgi:hypothetical protein
VAIRHDQPEAAQVSELGTSVWTGLASPCPIIMAGTPRRPALTPAATMTASD